MRPLFALLLFGCLVSSPLWVFAQAERLDADALLSHVRPEHRASLPAELEVPSVGALPGYDLHLSVAGDLHGFGLRETVEITNHEAAPLSDVVLRIFVNATPPEGMGPQVELVDGRCLDGPRCTVEQTSATVVRVVPEIPIAPGATLRMELDLTGLLEPIDPSRTGLLAQGLEGMSAFESGGGGHGYGLLAHDGTTATLAAFFPVLARRGARGWITDDHGTTGDLGTDAMVNVRARVVVPRGMVVAATGEAVRRRGVRDGDGPPTRDEITLHAGAIRDFALVLGRTLESSERDVGGVTVRSIYVPDHRDAGRSVLDHAAHALEIFERRFGPYPYTALDVVEAPLVGGAGGVEFSSLVTIATMFYGGDDGLGALVGMAGLLGGDEGALGVGTDMTASMLEFVTAHEVAHQWWHGIVGSDSREHPVTDEALAQWSSVLFMEEHHDAARAATEAERQVAMNYVMMRINGFADRAADQPASAFDPPVTYAGIVYGKAPFLWLRLRTLLGDEAFFAGIQAYVRRYRMRLAPPDGLLEVLAGAADRRTAREVRRLGRRYLHERHGDDDLGPIDEDRVMTSMLGMDMAEMGESGEMMRSLMRMMMRGMTGEGGEGGGLEGLLGGLGEGGLGEGLDPDVLRQLRELTDERGDGAPDHAPAAATGPTEDDDTRRGPTRIE